MNTTDCITLDTGSVAYSAEEAAMPIQDLIDLLQAAQGEGATHVVGLSGNYRGAGYAHIAGHSRMYGWVDDDE